MFTFKEFFKKNKPAGIEKLSKTRRSNIKSAVFERIGETENAAPKRSFRLNPPLLRRR